MSDNNNSGTARGT